MNLPTPVKIIDSWLNAITMYRLVLCGLIALAILGLVLGLSGPASLVILITSCWLSNTLFAKLFKAPTNMESHYITALILFLIMPSTTNLTMALVLFSTGVIAMASKYILTINKKHIFNPAALAVTVLMLTGRWGASWWVGETLMLPAVVIVGLLIVRKLRRFSLVLTFSVAYLITWGLTNSWSQIDQAVTAWLWIFFATIMLTEPLTTPPTRKLQMFYGAVVGVLFGSQFHFGTIFSTPEVALIGGNIFSFVVSPKTKLFLSLKEKIALAPGIYEFIFTNHQETHFTPGQYLEWTLPHAKSDIRGFRRYFTIASSPTEKDIHLAIKVPSKNSSFKSHLLNLNSKDTVVATQLAGDFTLPSDPNKKLAFIAGGIGITPYRSMIKYLIDRNESRDIILVYAATTAQEFVFKTIFDKAKSLGLKTVYIETQKVGYLTIDTIKKEIPDYLQRVFYISGPNVMVDNYQKLLQELHVSPSHIITDYFPGY